MFVDNQCASLLKEGRLRNEVILKAKIFSLATADEFLRYLQDLANGAPDAVKACASRVYGIL